jgi:hypothetical protein
MMAGQTGDPIKTDYRFGMETSFYIITVIFGLVWVWLNSVASLSVHHDATLDRFQKMAQTIFIWLIPYLGAAFVLHLVWQQYPSAIPKAWIPWPFKQLIYGKTIPPYQNRDDNESPAIDGACRSQRHDFSSFGGK